MKWAAPFAVRISLGRRCRHSSQRHGGQKAEGWAQRVGWMGRLMKPHRKHLYQLLANEKGIAHWKVSVGYGFLQLIVGVSVLVVRPQGIVVVLSLLAVWFGGFVWVSCVVRRSLVHHGDTEDTEG